MHKYFYINQHEVLLNYCLRYMLLSKARNINRTCLIKNKTPLL